MAAEMLLQYLWEHRLIERSSLTTVDGERVVIIDPGLRNNNAGPDFFNAKIMIGERMWAGNVEIHVTASDWMRHRHHLDPAYDSVILHVVGASDTSVSTSKGRVVPQMVMPYTPDYRTRYDAMVNDRSSRLPCASELMRIDPIYISDWIMSLGLERLIDKANRITDYLKRVDGDWQAAAYVTLARALGFSTNSEPFERLALATPLKVLLKHAGDNEMIEAALFGQAGFIDCCAEPEADRVYAARLLQNYSFMCAKYGLSAPESLGWRMARMRPPNFPQRRVAALSALICDGFKLGRNFAHVADEASARALFEVKLSPFWSVHYNFGVQAVESRTAFSHDTVTSLLINVIAPLMYAYGQEYGPDDCCERAVALLESLRPESNSLVSIFTDIGVPCTDAYMSQALIQLRRQYCEPRKCLYCRIGHRILTARAKP